MDTSLLLPHLEAAGARIAPRPEAPSIPALLTTGDVPAEYRAAREGCALFDATDRCLLRLSGPDAADFLHRILSNRVRELAPGTGSRNLLLDPKGKVRFDFDLEVASDALSLSAPPGTGQDLAAALDVYLFAEKVEILDATDTHAPLELCGPRTPEVLAAVLGEVPELEARAWCRLAWRDAELVLSSVTVAGQPGYRLDAGPDHVNALWSALIDAGARAAGVVVRDILRAESGVALYGVDIDENVYPQEARLEDAFSLEKGCYTGQEVVAKIDTYGGVNKLLLPLRVSHDDPVPRGTRLLLDQDGESRDLGVVTTWAYSFALDTGLVLAYVKRKHHEPGTSFRLSDGSGTATTVECPVR